MKSTKNPSKLEDLPPPPEGKVGWPWTEPTKIVRESVAGSAEFPLISVLIPSYNYGQFIEETIRSVLLQSYPNIQCVIIDGGSNDNTVNIIQKYSEYLDYWISEPDLGQTDAINKGYQHCTGDIFVWLNADDFYYSLSALETIANFYRQGYEFIAGECFNIDVNGNYRFEPIMADGKSSPTTFQKYLRYWTSSFLQQPALFVSKRLADPCFPLDTELYYAMDYQFFLRVLSQNPKAIWIEEKIVRLRWHKDSKTMGESLPIDPQELEQESEAHKVALAESKKLPTLWKRSLFQAKAFDYLYLEKLIHNQTFPNVWQVIRQLGYRPTLASWLLFWKIFFKAVLGTEFYAALRMLGGK
jgi:glycosyltransferase involved in cell wall biosynthesis